MFRHVANGPVDPINILKKLADGDTSRKKVDLGVGVYRNDQGQYHELDAIKKAKVILDSRNLGHDYEMTTGNPQFLRSAAKLLFSEDSDAWRTNRIASVQTISGTGANHLAALFLKRTRTFSSSKIYVGIPAWGNYADIFKLVGFEVVQYRHYNPANGLVDFQNVLDTMDKAEANSIFVLQGCCHNPTGADFSNDQWDTLSAKMKERTLFPFFDIAYQGLGQGMVEDSYGIRRFTDDGHELLIAQSFSKNFGLYGERCGVLHFLTEDADTTGRVRDQLRCLIRWEFSSSPAYGARLVDIILQDTGLTQSWLEELDEMRGRLIANRQQLAQELKTLQTPGDWRVVTTTSGLFCYLPISTKQCIELRDKHHVYMTEQGRINIAGLNQHNIGVFAKAMDRVVRDTAVSGQ